MARGIEAVTTEGEMRQHVSDLVSELRDGR